MNSASDGNARASNPRGDTLGKDDGHLANESEFLEKERDLPPLGQFTGEVHMRTVKDGTTTTTDEILLYHDKQAPGLVPYSVYYGRLSRYYWRWDASRRVAGYRAGNPSAQTGNFDSNNQKIGVSAVDWGTPPTNNLPTVNGRLTIHTRALSAEETALFASPEFPSTIPSQVFSYGAGAGQRTLPFDGTFFNGRVAGKYNCSGTCTIARDSKGETLRFTGTWTFTPTAPAHEIMLPVDHDADYLAFGYWVQTTTRPGQDPAYVIRTLVTGSKPFGRETQQFSGDNITNNSFAGLRGTSTYKGRAVGRYGRHVLDQNGRVASSSTGLFTAKTTLTAQFGDNTNEVAPNDQFAITGTVTDFKPFDPTTRQDLLADWTVELQKARFQRGTANEYSSTFPISRRSAPATRAKAPTRGLTGTTPGVTPGDWVGRFFGLDGPRPTQGRGSPYGNNRPGPDGRHPSGVAGAFDANFTNGNVRGAFGATRSE